MTSALERYQAKKTAAKAAWTPPTLADFAQDVAVLSFDQSLSRTGWVYLRVLDGRMDVMAKNTIRTRTEVTGWRGNFDKARQIRREMEFIDDFLMRFSPDQMPRWPDVVLLEMPNVHGHRTESSMMAAYEIDGYSNTWWRPTEFISIQQSRTIIGGSDVRNDKKGGWKALTRYVEESGGRQWNEHQRDAAINALGHLYNLKKQQEAADDRQ